MKENKFDAIGLKNIFFIPNVPPPANVGQPVRALVVNVEGLPARHTYRSVAYHSRMTA